VVEDDASMREAIERLLRTAGIGCSCYVSAEALLEAGAASTASCVVSDQKLPAMSGLELLAALRSRGVCAPLILITAHDSPAMRERATREGAQAYLAKPFRGTALIAAVSAAIAS
jgi:two-component system, LuxR family, response regulator FixJ